MFLQSLTNAALEQSLSATWQRMQMISTNIVNEDTPGYKAKRMDFEAMLGAELNSLRNTQGISRRQAVRRIGEVHPRVYEDTSTIGRADGNNVDSNTEHIELARAQLLYQALSQKVTGYYSTLRHAISGGR